MQFFSSIAAELIFVIQNIQKKKKVKEAKNSKLRFLLLIKEKRRKN